MKKDNKGFSLVELLVVIAIMVVLVGVIAPSLLGNIEKSRESRDIQTLDSIASAVQYALADEKGYEAAMEKNGGNYVYNNQSVLLSTIWSKTDAFATAIKDNLGNGDAPELKCKAANGASIYVTINDTKVKVSVKGGSPLDVIDESDTKSKIKLEVTR